MTIKYLQTYQGVRFEKTTNTYFVSAELNDPAYGMRAVRVYFEEREHGVLVFNDGCAVLVGWANIGSLEYERSTVKTKQDVVEAKEPKSKK